MFAAPPGRPPPSVPPPPPNTHNAPSPRPQSLLEYLKGICADVKLVQGDFDDFEAPEHLVGGAAGQQRRTGARAAGGRARQ
jgi:hypothetical protein